MDKGRPFDHEIIEENCISKDFSRCGIKSIPDEILYKLVNIQYLYLEGNDLTELNPSLFPTLRELRWLDLRNNKLRTIPNSVMDHPSLQVLLLEGNHLESIPIEIGSVKTLRGLQLARNPLEYPPPHIVNQGVQSTIEFLQKEWLQMQSPQQIHLISETHSQTKTAQSKQGRRQKVSGSKSAVVNKVGELDNSHLSAANLSRCINVQPISRDRRQAPQDVGQVLMVDNPSSSVNCKKRSRSLTKARSSVPLDNDHSRSNNRDMQLSLIRDIWIEKVREMLLKQDAILQRRKNVETLQQWQDETKLLKQTHVKKVSCKTEVDFPFGTDPEYLKILSRKDLKEDWNHRRESSPHNFRHEEPINNRIVSIMTALQELQTSQSSTLMSPRTEQKILSEEIKKIRDIQRSLSALKLKNFGQLGYSR
ncbi:leucine-rich repeat-containing protein 27-like [Macrosteles quadrilineatus]|uniref:leucine-rich repeat-containing protein 27-like n=1 Tax=Macrosteles quadrilineatus TaxID=74068 RepID=UPI0023E1EC2F|nr:leucine-rich repeat-containing protein 27-like [Macrosteles quadrilineatus]